MSAMHSFPVPIGLRATNHAMDPGRCSRLAMMLMSEYPGNATMSVYWIFVANEYSRRLARRFFRFMCGQFDTVNINNIIWFARYLRYRFGCCLQEINWVLHPCIFRQGAGGGIRFVTMCVACEAMAEGPAREGFTNVRIDGGSFDDNDNPEWGVPADNSFFSPIGQTRGETTNETVDSTTTEIAQEEANRAAEIIDMILNQENIRADGTTAPSNYDEGNTQFYN